MVNGDPKFCAGSWIGPTATGAKVKTALKRAVLR